MDLAFHNTIGIMCVSTKCTRLFDWSMYEIEQTQMLQTSIKERHLNSVHRDKHVDSSSAHKFLSSDGVIETLFPDPSYTIERHTPLSTTPQLDLYFTKSELVTLSLLSTACVEYLCKNDSEYCFVHFKKREFTNPPSTLQITKKKCKRKTPTTTPSTSPHIKRRMHGHKINRHHEVEKNDETTQSKKDQEGKKGKAQQGNHTHRSTIKRILVWSPLLVLKDEEEE